MPRTLGEIAVDAGLVTKADAARAVRLAELRKQPLVAVLVRDLGVDEVALIGALRKQTRVPLIDPASIEIEPEALRQLPRDVCARLRVLPLALIGEGHSKLIRIAMADPTDSAVIAEIEQLTHCDVEVWALPLSAIDELVDLGYRQVNTAVVRRAGIAGTPAHLLPRPSSPATSVVARGRHASFPEAESEVSVTAQIPIAALQPMALDELESRLNALIAMLVAKGLISEAELAELLHKPRP